MARMQLKTIVGQPLAETDIYQTRDLTVQEPRRIAIVGYSSGP
jgi:hypothetical protein